MHIKEEQKIKFTNSEKFDLAIKRKSKLEAQFEFLKNIYNENFIWELLSFKI